MPSSDQNSYKVTTLSATWLVPLVIYFNFESFLRSVSGCRGPSSRAFTQVKEIHEPCGFALTAIDHHSTEPKFYQVESSEDCTANIFENATQTYQVARDINMHKRKYPCFKGDRRSLDKSEATQSRVGA